MRRVGDELPPWKGLVFPRRAGTLPNVPHDAGTFTTLLVGNQQDRCRRPYGLDGGKRNRSPAKPGQSKERSLPIQLDTLNATEWSAIRSDCGKPLTPFEPVLSHGASAPKTGSSICFDAWSPSFEPGRGHRTDCLRVAKQASCNRSPSNRDTSMPREAAEGSWSHLGKGVPSRPPRRSHGSGKQAAPSLARAARQLRLPLRLLI
jgi:hypothetical protein